MSAATDRRTLAIGAVTMVVFLLIGIGSAAVFARPSCRLVAPTVNTVDATRADLSTQTDDDALRDVVDELGQAFGATVDVFAVADAVTLTVFRDRLAAIGTSALLFDEAHRPDTQLTFRGGHVVGSGDVLYATVLSNPTSGQVDAVQPIDRNLTAGTCVELALVSSPLAFLLDAADGEVLFLRADEDGRDPFVEVRDPVVGRRLAVDVELAVGSAGRHGVRSSGVFSDDVVVYAQAAPDEPDSTALWVIDRNDGTVRFTVSHAAVRDAVAMSGEPSELTWQVRSGDGDVMLAVTNGDTERFLSLSVIDGTLTPEPHSDGADGLMAQYRPLIESGTGILLKDALHLNGTDVLLVETEQHTAVLILSDRTSGHNR